MSTVNAAPHSKVLVLIIMWVVIVAFAFASYLAGGIEDSRIALATFLGIGTIFGLFLHRLYKTLVEFDAYIFTRYFAQNKVAADIATSTSKKDINASWNIWFVLSFVAIAALGGWGVFAMDHGALRTFLGFAGGLAAYEAAVSPLVTLAFPHF